MSHPRTVLPAALTAVAVALVGAPAAPAAATVPAASQGTLTAEGGNVRATLTYTKVTTPSAPSNKQAAHLTITRAGAGAYDAPVASSNCSPCGLEEFVGAPPPLSVADLEGSGEPDVILDLYTGGAHCCSIMQIFRFDPATAAYRALEHDFGDPGAQVVDLAGNGHLELRSADDRFAYEFAPFAYSGLPLQVWELVGGRLVDSTRSFAPALAADAKVWLKAFRSSRRSGTGTGAIAAWAADEELLGNRTLVKRTLAREAAHGNLRSREHYGPSGHRFVVALMRFLRRLGYLSA